ncbi:hypothetical protein EE612_050154 [Oryza sativa]|nr:hypothetical protein EE612_050154 [Oryza sativa]
MSSVVFASARLNATNQNYLPVPSTLATAYEMQHGDSLRLRTSHGLKIKIRIKEAASTLYMTTGWKEFAEATGLETGETILFRMSSRSKARVMLLNRQCLIRCPVKTPSTTSSDKNRSLSPSDQLTRASTCAHPSTSKSIPPLRNGTGSTKRSIADTSFCHQLRLTAEN